MRTEVAMTTKGLVAVDQLGVTLTHEHLLLDLACCQTPPKNERQRSLVNMPLGADILADVHSDPLVFSDNLRLDDPALALEELREFKLLGGHTVVDLTTHGLSPRVEEVRSIGEQADVHVILGCGYYVQSTHPREVADSTVSDLTDFFMREIVDGVAGSGIRPGVIGEIGISEPAHRDEWKVLTAACKAQKETGLPLFVHTYPEVPGESTVTEVARFVIDQGVHPARLNMCHMDAYRDLDDAVKIAEMGAMVSLDLFGRLDDPEREHFLLELLDRGYEDQLLISQDVCMKTHLRRYGGFGYGHILREIVPILRSRDVANDVVQKLLIENPRKILALQQ